MCLHKKEGHCDNNGSIATELRVRPTLLCTINYEHTIIYEMDKCLPYNFTALNHHWPLCTYGTCAWVYIMRCFNVCNYLMRCHNSLNFDVMINSCARRSSTFLCARNAEYRTVSIRLYVCLLGKCLLSDVLSASMEWQNII